jgi:hypothetical protein
MTLKEVENNDKHKKEVQRSTEPPGQKLKINRTNEMLIRNNTAI